ncbi:hypothetical protein K501DRAFT_209085, partial [Backusella circina FSU 941]
MGKSKHEKEKKQVDVLEQLRKLAKEQKKKDSKKKEKKGKKEKSVKKDNMTPMTKEDYEKQHNTIRTQLDPQTGRLRRVRATGEILESIVTKEQHYQINKTATRGDGLYYQTTLYNAAKDK